MNTIQVAYDELPFGGTKHSGFGKEHGVEVLDFAGHVVLEVSTSSARSAHERQAILAESLQFARTHLLH